MKRQDLPAFSFFSDSIFEMTTPKCLFKALIFGSAFVATIVGLPARAQTLPTEGLAVRFFQITAEIAQSPADRTRGLMGRQSLKPNHGMLFVFEASERQCFWMKNTPLPLTIAFIAEDGRIVNFADMQPFSEEPHCSAQPVRYALEMEQGWFSKRGVMVGDTIAGPSLRK